MPRHHILTTVPDTLEMVGYSAWGYHVQIVPAWKRRDWMDAASNGFTMVLMHGVASMILAAVLSRSDDAVALLRAWLAPVLGVVPSVQTPPAVPRDLVAAVPAPTAPLPVHASVPSLRGPPAPSARLLPAQRG